MLHNPNGKAPLLLLCDHASNDIPSRYASLGLRRSVLNRHVAWDIGARSLALTLATLLDAPLVCSTVSRLVIDTNRAIDASDLIPEMADSQSIPGNSNLASSERRHRINEVHEPYHCLIEEVISQRPDVTTLIAIHSFTQRLSGEDRPWHVGILHASDRRLAERLIAVLRAQTSLCVGDNQPYGPGDGVYYTLARHAGGRQSAMIEVRNDQLRTPAGQQSWAKLLGDAIASSMSILGGNATQTLPRAPLTGEQI